MADGILNGIRTESETLMIARQHLPFWIERGLEDYSCTIHSTGLTYWNLMGRALGFHAIGEMPAPQNGPYALVGGDVRSDSVWLGRDGEKPLVLVEFERCNSESDEAKLLGKMESLLLAHHRWNQSAKVLVLAYWTKRSMNLPNHERLRHRVRSGFMTAAREQVRGASNCEIVFFQTIVKEDTGRWKLSQVIERGIT